VALKVCFEQLDGERIVFHDEDRESFHKRECTTDISI
jgi:hypothetical protein